MAVSKAPAGGTDREYQAKLNSISVEHAEDDAIRIMEAGTEKEIWTDALGEDDLDNDGDTSLEDMGEGNEGEVVEDEDVAEEEAEGEGEEAEGEQGEEAEAAEGEEGEQAQEPPRDQRGQFREREPAVPPGRLREQTQRATAAEERAQLLERQVAEMNGRLAELSARANAPQPRQQQTEAPPPKPDKWSDEEGYERWVMDQAVKQARAEIEPRFAQFEQRIQQQQQEVANERIGTSIGTAVNGPRGLEVAAAYTALLTRPNTDPQARALVQSMYRSPDPAQVLLDWFEEQGGADYRERYSQYLMSQNQNGQRRQGRNEPPDQQQPRQVFRPAQRLPSLNSATGSNSQRVSDPEMLDGSDRSIFDFGTRR
jgi:hypothetical protein